MILNENIIFKLPGMKTKMNKIIECNTYEYSTNPLPYIEIKETNLKLLSQAVPKLSTAKKYLFYCISHSKVDIKRLIISKIIKFQTEIPAFQEFYYDYNINFML